MLSEFGQPMISIRAFRALEDPTGCERFLEGHRRVLTSIGVKEVTSAKADWMEMKSVFVIIVESEDGSQVLGGARIHAADTITPLPIEEATGFIDPKIFPLVESKIPEGTGEICGLWNSRQVAGMGIGSMFLTLAAVAIAPQIGLNSLFALCAPYTVAMAESVGYHIVREIGNNGTFYYPKMDLLATVMMLKDTEELSTASEQEKNKILKLRNEPTARTLQLLKNNNEVIIDFKLEINNIVKTEFHLQKI